MFNHIIKIALRNFTRTPTHSFINIFGLSLGIAVSILVLLFVKDELTYDTFHGKSSSLYRLYNTFERRDGTFVKSPSTPFVAGATLKDNFEEVKGITPWTINPASVLVDGEAVEQTFGIVSKDFFKMFDFPVVSGSVQGVFNDPSDIVITVKTAKKFFGASDPVGKTLTLLMGPDEKIYEVKAVVEDPPSNSSLQFEALLHEDNMRAFLPDDLFTDWGMVFSETYVLLEEGVSSGGLEEQFPDLMRSVRGEEEIEKSKYTLGLQPLTEIHLDTDMPQGEVVISDPKYTFILSGIALMVLLMAIINFMNLSLARSLARTREIGIKKVAGAGKRQLVFQFIGEAVWMSMLSLIAGLLFARLALPLFNDLSGKELVFWFSLINVSLFFGTALFTGVLAGTYPAFVLSSFQPTRVLKGQVSIGQGKQGLRKIMLGIQLSLSLFLITSVIIMKSQLDYIRNKNLGFDKEQVVIVPLNVPQNIGFDSLIVNGIEKGKLLKQELQRTAGVVSVALSAQEFEEGGWMRLGYNDTDEVLREFHMNVVDEDYVPMLDIQMKAGRNFEKGNASDARRSVIVNEAFVKEYDLEDPVGSRLPHDKFEDHEIIGVAKDFHFSSLHDEIAPAILVMEPVFILKGINNLSAHSSFVPKALVKLQAGQVEQGLADIRNAWDMSYPGESFSYHFVDDKVEEQYKADGNFGKVVTASTVLATLIGTLGLFGLVSLTMGARIKEISIRKVLGADSFHLTRVLSSSYVVIILISIILASPFAYFFAQNWLDNFQYSIAIGAWHFILGGLLLFVIGALAIGWQVIMMLRSRAVEHLSGDS